MKFLSMVVAAFLSINANALLLLCEKNEVHSFDSLVVRDSRNICASGLVIQISESFPCLITEEVVQVGRNYQVCGVWNEQENTFTATKMSDAQLR